MLLDFCHLSQAFERKSLPVAGETADIPPPKRRRVTSGERLLRAVLELAGSRAELVSHAEVPWASVTFSGARHTVVLRFEGWEACDNAEHLIAELPEHEFTLPNVLVADAAVARMEQHLLPEPRIEMELELLLLEDA